MKIDFYSQTWDALRAEITKKIEQDRDKLEGNLDAIDTAAARGRIQAYKSILLLEKAQSK